MSLGQKAEVCTLVKPGTQSQGVKKPPGVQMYRSASFDTPKETYAGILKASDLVAAVKVPFHKLTN